MAAQTISTPMCDAQRFAELRHMGELNPDPR